MTFDVIILAGGFGTRLQSVVSDVPKPMAPVAGVPFLDHLLAKLPHANIKRIILSVGYKHEVVESYYGNSYMDVPIVYIVEDEPLGTGGAIKLAMESIASEHVLVMNGDTMFALDFEQLIQAHAASNADMTIALKQIHQPDRYGTVLMENDQIVRFSEKQVGLQQGMINCGIYWMNSEVTRHFPNKTTFSFETEFLERKVNELHFAGYIDSGLFIDIGIPQDYERAQEIFAK